MRQVTVVGLDAGAVRRAVNPNDFARGARYAS
jgi:hypothetical protein